MKLIKDTAQKPVRTRSEDARQRRSSTAQKRTVAARSNVTTPRRAAVPSPVVTVRGKGLGTPAVKNQKPGGKVRRQYYYALGATGAEVRLPAVPLVKPGWRLLSAALVLALSAALYFAFNTPQIQVNQISISGLKRIKPAEMESILDLRNVPIFMVDPAALQDRLQKAFPELASVAISVSLPAEVTVTAKERLPVLSWEVQGDTYWADKDGILFKARGKASGLVAIQSDENPPLVITDIPLTGDTPTPSTADQMVTADKNVQGPAKDLTGQQIDPVVLKAALYLKKAIPAGTNLTFTSKNGLGWEDPAGWKVYLGLDLENIDVKLTVYKAVVAKLAADGVTPVMISVENVNAPFYRLEQ